MRRYNHHSHLFRFVEDVIEDFKVERLPRDISPQFGLDEIPDDGLSAVIDETWE